MIVKAMRDLLLAETEITDRITTYNFSADVVEPSIFTTVLPFDITFPAINIIEIGSYPETQNNCGGGFRQAYDVRIYDNRGKSLKHIREISYYVFIALNRQSFESELFSGWFECNGGRLYPEGKVKAGLNGKFMTDDMGYPSFSVPVMARVWLNT